ncbi:hypothetical protein PPL_09746 [Heterostelium album PN500]|uniref:Secreted protein n=1 Tax=Heterostelium pallidum (strain ATCC 26659 / Pp 5 / PN500) TaxID=670386 RepID=D3BNP3_HETP5|nr:hypothetical protein PPL_09746 [Heterostelium album PN500]EFA76994.1 hypothetical protein PPL_09746 [Heterostelium album PN500]|eukprot:XP_020429125.1 hypothetical protein PPL_09746 [Heterostelium album PN500]
MNKLFIVTLFCALFVVASTNASAASDLGDLVLGVVEGLEFTVSSHAKQCIRDTKHTVTAIKDGLEDIDHGFSKKSVHDVADGLKDFGGALIVIPEIYEECGISKFVSEIKTLASRLKSGEAGVIDVVLRELINIFHNRHDLTSYFKDAIADEKKGSYTDCGINVGKIIGVLLRD